MYDVVEVIRATTRRELRSAARWLNYVSGGMLRPDLIKIFYVLMHLPVAILIARGKFITAAVFMVIFRFLEMLNNGLAAVQKRSSLRSTIFAASANRIKEVMLYSGVGYFLARTEYPATAVWAVIACGASLVVGYVEAKGEAVVAASKKSFLQTGSRSVFYEGIFSLEVRMFVLFLGLVTNQLLFAVASIAVLTTLVAVQRLATISETLE